MHSGSGMPYGQHHRYAYKRAPSGRLGFGPAAYLPSPLRHRCSDAAREWSRSLLGGNLVDLADTLINVRLDCLLARVLRQTDQCRRDVFVRHDVRKGDIVGIVLSVIAQVDFPLLGTPISCLPMTYCSGGNFIVRSRNLARLFPGKSFIASISLACAKFLSPLRQ